MTEPKPWGYSAPLPPPAPPGGKWSFTAQAASLGFTKDEIEDYKAGRLTRERAAAVTAATQKALDALRARAPEGRA